MAFYCFSVFCKGCLEQHIICSVALCINVNTYVRTSAHTQACALERGSILAVAKLRPGQEKKTEAKKQDKAPERDESLVVIYTRGDDDASVHIFLSISITHTQHATFSYSDNNFV